MRFNKYQFNILIVIAIFMVDRLLKLFFYHTENILISYTKNSGIAFGVYLPKVFLLPLVTGVVVFLSGLLIIAWRQKNQLSLLGYFAIILGAISNIIDRLKYDFVIDYIDLKIWPVFNLADVLILGGVVLILYQLYRPSQIKY